MPGSLRSAPSACSPAEPTSEPSREGNAALTLGQRDDIQWNVFLLEELLHLTRREKHPCTSMHKEQDACTLHFLSEGADSAHRMMCVQFNAHDGHPLPCRFVMHEFQKIF